MVTTRGWVFSAVSGLGVESGSGIMMVAYICLVVAALLVLAAIVVGRHGFENGRVGGRIDMMWWW